MTPFLSTPQADKHDRAALPHLTLSSRVETFNSFVIFVIILDNLLK